MEELGSSSEKCVFYCSQRQKGGRGLSRNFRWRKRDSVRQVLPRREEVLLPPVFLHSVVIGQNEYIAGR